jgi:hypothetical protein
MPRYWIPSIPSKSFIALFFQYYRGSARSRGIGSRALVAIYLSSYFLNTIGVRPEAKVLDPEQYFYRIYFSKTIGVGPEAKVLDPKHS